MQDSKREELEERFRDKWEEVKHQVFRDMEFMNTDFVNGYSATLDYAMEYMLEFVETEAFIAKREVLEKFKKIWDNDNLGDYPKYGNAGIGMLKREFRDYIQSELDKLSKKNKCSGK